MEQALSKAPKKSVWASVPPVGDLTVYENNHVLVQEGKASWYGGRKIKSGKRTASGSSFDISQYTAAHNFLPFGTVVRVHNLKNGKYVDVTINDRGPHTHNRVIDISRSAAAELGMISDGVASVRLEAIGCTLDDEDTLSGAFWVQVNSRSLGRNELKKLQGVALEEKKELKVKYTARSKKQKSKVLLGPYNKLHEAVALAGKIYRQYPETFVIAD